MRKPNYIKTQWIVVVSIFTFAANAQISVLGDINNMPIRQQQAVETITASIGYQGYDESQPFFGQGEYEIFLDNTTGVLDRPIIILDGFDPGDARDINGLYNSLSFDQQNLADILRDEGYDIVILNAPTYTTEGVEIDGGGDYIQRNAMVFIELINFLNENKVGEEQLVVLGASMGGLIAQYGLAFMENNSLDPETRLYISFDAPHRGANVPIGLQYLINYLAVQSGDPLAQQVIDELLNSAAAKEMLVDHLNAHLADGSEFEQDPNEFLPAGAPGFRNEFQAELDALGFPQNIRNVAMVNGSGLGTTIGTPGMQVVETSLDLGAGITGDVELHFMPESSQTIEITRFDTSIVGIPISSFSTIGGSTALSDGVDSAPGGFSNISNALGAGGGNPVIEDFIAALQQDEFSFIPLISSLAIQGENDWYATPDVSNSPFANTYIPDSNEAHVSVTQESAQFALDEIRNGTFSIAEFSSREKFKLVSNPVQDLITITVDESALSGPVSAALYSVEGKALESTVNHTSTTQITIKQNLSPGVYILTISDERSAQSFKVIVN